MNRRSGLILLGMMCVWSVSFADQLLIPAGAVWKYLDNGTNQGTAWRASTFDDRTWASGAAQLGYGDGDETTVVYSGPSTSRYVTTYFRKAFSINDASVFSEYVMQLKRDDGVVVYVNGVEAYRNNMPGGTISYTTFASAVAGDDGKTFISAGIPASYFRTGTNVIAVEIHQVGRYSSDISFDLSLKGIEDTDTTTEVNEVLYLWSGALQPGSAQVAAKLSRASASCRLLVSTSSSLSNPKFSEVVSVTSSTNLMAKFSISGLKPKTTYFYAIQSEGLTDTSKEDIGKFRTPASGAFSYKFTVGACAVSSDHKVYNAMKNKAPLFHLSTGDFHYANPNSATNINVHRLPYEQNMLSQAPSRGFFLFTPLAYTWDDHDYSGNNSNGSSAGKLNARLAYQEYVPHYALPAGKGDVPIYQSFTIGRIHFILSDLRSERGTTIMSSAQKSWFKNQCLYARDNNLIIAWVSAVSFGGDRLDNWGGFAAERTELSNFFRDNNIRNMFILSGDAHMLAIDNGRNHDFSTGSNNPHNYPVFQAAAVNNTGSTKGGSYSEGGTFPNPNAYTGQYGLVEVTDTGGASVTIKFTGYRTSGNTTTESILTSYTFSRSLVEGTEATALALRTLENDQKVLLTWHSPGSTEAYTLERSTDGINFEDLGSFSAEDSQFVDEQPEDGWNYYQLRQGGTLKTEKIFIGAKLKMSIFPNPAQDMASISLFNVDEPAYGRYILYNSAMKAVSQGTTPFIKGANLFKIDVSQLTAGEYVLHIVLNGKEIVEKMIITR